MMAPFFILSIFDELFCKFFIQSRIYHISFFFFSFLCLTYQFFGRSFPRYNRYSETRVDKEWCVTATLAPCLSRVRVRCDDKAWLASKPP